MPQDVSTNLKAPDQCSPGESELFYKRTCQSGEVSRIGLRERINQAHLLGFVISKGHVVATGAVKRPNSAYRESIERKSGFALPERSFPFELGWIFVPSEYGRQGYASALIAALLGAVSGQGVFATTRTNNGGMNAMLPGRFAFVATGQTFLATNQANRLRLYTRG